LPFTAQELIHFAAATFPDSQLEALERRKIMRRARSNVQLPLLLEELKARYESAPSRAKPDVKS
jgi:hypothetical protein